MSKDELTQRANHLMKAADRGDADAVWRQAGAGARSRWRRRESCATQGDFESVGSRDGAASLSAS
ncbi:hypothetical protein A5686_06145 [Mycobacterium sp. E2479]|nr:hypothetical protein A5686_06145 [Mycobacterium sp. E2479]